MTWRTVANIYPYLTIETKAVMYKLKNAAYNVYKNFNVEH